MAVDETTDALLRTLTPREEKVIRMLYGIGQPVRDRGEIAEHFGVVAERLEQIISKALRKINHPSRKKYRVRSFFAE